MQNQSKKISAKQIGDEKIKKLNLPPSDCLKSNNLEDSYRLLAQALWNAKEGKKNNSYLESNLHAALAELKSEWKDFPDGSPSPENFEKWFEQLLKCEAVVEARQIYIAKCDAVDGNVQIKYLREVAKVRDFEQINNLKNDDFIEEPLYVVLGAPPDISKIKRLENPSIFFISKEKNRKIYLTCNAAVNDITKQLIPHNKPKLSIYTPSFLDEEGNPIGDIDLENIEQMFENEWTAEEVESWSSFMQGIDNRCKKAFGYGLGELTQNIVGRNAHDLNILVCDTNSIRGTWTKEYDDIINGKRNANLLNVMIGKSEKTKKVELRTARRELFLGHMDERTESESRKTIPLDATQRLAAMTTIENCNSKTPVMAVNGPPGTGKTSFLRAVLASMWVDAALNKKENPPLIVGTSATNKAVSNIIEAFSNVASLPPTDGRWEIHHRWIKGLPSYGWLYPSKDAQATFPNMMHLVKDNESDFTPYGAAKEFAETDIATIEAHFKACAKTAFQIKNDTEIQKIVEHLHKSITKNVNEMLDEQKNMSEDIERLQYMSQLTRGTSGKRNNLTIEIDKNIERTKEIDESMKWHEDVINLLTTYQKIWHTNRKSWKSMMPKFLRERLLKLSIESEYEIVKQIGIIIDSNNDIQAINITDIQSLLNSQTSIAETSIKIDEVLNSFNKFRITISQERLVLKDRIHKAKTQRDEIKLNIVNRKIAYKAIVDRLHNPTTRHPTERTNATYIARGVMSAKQDTNALNMLWHRFDSNQDINYRVKLFHLSARYWEGRWILNALKNNDRLITARNLSISNTDQSNLNGSMQLCVIIVSTIHKLNALGNAKEIDMLVMDESGQCSPDVAGIAFSYSKSALVVGDEKQLQPVITITEQQCDQIANQLGIGVEYMPKSINGATGSALAMARHATTVTDDVDGKGVTLLYHYRCHPVIVEYFNQMMYNGRIKCFRKDEPTKAGLPPMSWVDVPESKPEKIGTSWANEQDIETIARWIEDSHEKLTIAYQKPLSEILAVITPLKAQGTKIKPFLIDRLQHCIEKEQIEKMVTGTVHALQGAERPIVAFSLVQHRKDTKLFADRDGGFLMNVAASRAKDAFIVFGNRDSLRPAACDSGLNANDQSTPTGKLGQYMRTRGKRLFPNRLVIVEAPNKIYAIQKNLGIECEVYATCGSFRQSSLSKNNTLEWSEAPESIKHYIASHIGMINDVVIATDDDMMGEIIGMHVAEIVRTIHGDLPLKRMRFYSMEKDHLQAALENAGDDFDADLLAAALTREAIRHIDKLLFDKKAPDGLHYTPSPDRSIVNIVKDLTSSKGTYIKAIVKETETGKEYTAFVAESYSPNAPMAEFDNDEYEDSKIKISGIENKTFNILKTTHVSQLPTLYPSSTTSRILGVAADELGILPWHTQEHLDRMYEQGAKNGN